METQQYIREGRIGPPKSWKTGAVVSTYRRPILVFNFDAGGLDIVTEKIEYVEPKQILAMSKLTTDQLPPITAVNFWDIVPQKVGVNFTPSGTGIPFITFVECINYLVDSCPWKTIVLDPVTGLNERVISQVAITNSKAMEDPRKWASMVGSKVQQVINVMCMLKADSVCIMHTSLEKDEKTGTISTLPIIPSRAKERIGALFSQFFYACIEGGKPVIYTRARGWVSGIGARWPQNLPEVCGPTYKEIYGTRA